jgi:hypothetical protein
LALGATLALNTFTAAYAADESLPKPDAAFNGKIAVKRDESVPTR